MTGAGSKMILFYAGLAGTTISLLLMVFGPQEGMETLGVGLVAYFNLLYHLVAGPLVLFWLWRRKRPLLQKFIVAAYFAIIYAVGLYQYIVVSDLDDAAREKMAEVAEPQGYRLRELGFQLDVAASRGSAIDQDVMAEMMALIPRSESLNSRTQRYRPALWYLAGIGAEDAVRELIANGAALDDPELYDTSPLYHAATRGHTDIVRLLLAAGAGLNDVIDAGLARGLDINDRWRSGLIDNTALFAAIGAGHEATVAHLFARGAELPTDFAGDVLVQNCYLQAARHPRVLELLVRRYLAGERQRREEKLMRHWVAGTAEPAAALAVLDRLGISR